MSQITKNILTKNQKLLLLIKHHKNLCSKCEIHDCIINIIF